MAFTKRLPFVSLPTNLLHVSILLHPLVKRRHRQPVCFLVVRVLRQHLQQKHVVLKRTRPSKIDTKANANPVVGQQPGLSRKMPHTHGGVCCFTTARLLPVRVKCIYAHHFTPQTGGEAISTLS